MQHLSVLGRKSLSFSIGLKQGDPCSPILFMLFINDIVQNIKADSNDIFTVDDMQLFILLYCDDAVVFAKSTKVLKSMLYDIETYCTQRGLKINTKTKAMIFEKGRHSHFVFYINNTKLELVTSFKYLGIHFFKNGNWYRTQKLLAQHASFASFFHYFGNYQCLKNVKCSIYSLVPYSDTVQRSGVYMRQKTSKSCTRIFADGYLMSKNLQIYLAYMENWVGYHS